MATVKKIRKLVKGKMRYQAKVGGEVITIKTGCKTVAQPLISSDGALAGKCKNCQTKTPETSAVCLALHAKEGRKLAKERKKTLPVKAKADKQPWEDVIHSLAMGMDRKVIVANNLDRFNSDATARWFVGACGCCYNALAGKSKKVDGIVFLYSQYLLNGEKGEEPVGDKSSIYCVKKTFEVIQKMEAEMEET